MNVYWLGQCAADLPAEDDWLNRHELQRLGLLRVPKRRADWRLGRWTAKHAVAAYLELNPDSETLAKFEIASAPTGAPAVIFQNNPLDLCISLSHREGRAVCALSPAGTRVGCDLELIEEHSQSFLEDYFTVEEQAMVERASPGDRRLLIALLWSAKESALKVLQTGLRLDTRSVAVKINYFLSNAEDGLCSRNFELKLGVSTVPCHPPEWSKLSVSSRDGQIFEGWWQQSGEFVSTIVTTVSTASPMCFTAESTTSLTFSNS